MTLGQLDWTFLDGIITRYGIGVGGLLGLAGAITGAVNISSALSAIDFGSETWTVSNSWTNASTDGVVWEAGSGTIIFDSATAQTMTFAGANLAEDEFFNVTFASTAVGSITFTMATRGLRLGAALVIDSTTILAKATFTLTVGTMFTLGAGEANALTSTSGAVVIGTDVSVADATAYIDLGSEAWTVSGTWTNSTTSASWDAGTGTVTFDAVAGGTMTFAGANLAEDEFSSVTFASTAAGSITFTMATRGLRLGGALVIDSTTILTKATFTLTVGGAFTLGAGEANALTSTSGDVTITGAVSVDDATAYIDFGSEAWTVSGTWTNSTTSATWDAGTGSMLFNSTANGTYTFAGANLAEPEFVDIDFRSAAAGAITFTMATRGLRLSGILDIDDAAGSTTLDSGGFDIQQSSFVDIDNGGIIAMGTGNFTDIFRLDVDDLGSLTMDGQSILEFSITTSDPLTPVEFDITTFTLYSMTPGGVPDIRWTMDPTVAGSTVRIGAGNVVAVTTFALYRDTIQMLTGMSMDIGGGDMELQFDLAGGWSLHDMIIALPGLAFGGGGGGPTPDPIIDWTWRHLANDLTVQLIVASPNSEWAYEWFIDGKSLGSQKNLTVGWTVEYVFELSGIHKVVLKATFIDKSYSTPKDVEAKSVSFIGRYMPVLAMVLIAVWFLILVLTETWPSDAGRLWGISAGLAAFGIGWWIVQNGYLTFSLSSAIAMQMFAGIGVIIAGAAFKKAKAFGAVFIIVGAVLLFLVYRLILL